ncbi:MAG: SHOCT domain-containing protein [Motilibacteraceae bacterium]
MMDWYGGLGWGGWVWMTLMMLAFWSLLIGGGFLLYRGIRGAEHTSHESDAAHLLDERFARGEIDVEEYRARRELLGSGR